jgi:alpha-L-rhamnosidase
MNDELQFGQLRCEHLVNPLGINVPHPRLSWILESDQRAERQTAYHVLVASSPERLADDQGDLRDSGNMDVAGFFPKWIRDVEGTQAPEGGYPMVVPNPIAHKDNGSSWPEAARDSGPAWADAGIICPWTIYLCYGDSGLLAERYASMQRFVEFLNATSRHGIRCYAGYPGWQGYGDWLALDGSTDRFRITSKELLGMAFFAYSSRLLAQIARVLGKNADADRYEAMFEKTRQAFQARLVTAGGLIAGGAQTCYVLALHFDLLPTELRPVALAELVRDIERRGVHLSTGFVGTSYINLGAEQERARRRGFCAAETDDLAFMALFS